MSDLAARDHALRVAVLSTIEKEITGAAKSARKDAEAAFGPLRRDGQSQQKVLLPDGEEIGLISIKAGQQAVDVTDKALTEWLAEHNPEGLEHRVDPEQLGNAELVDIVRAVLPDLITTRIRAAVRTALVKEIQESGGYLVDRETGEKVKVGEVTDHQPTGAFSYRGDTGARDKVIAAWQRGELREIALGALALPAPEGGVTGD